METVVITKQNAIKAFTKADATGKSILANLLGHEVFDQPIIERVKTFQDACDVCGETAENVAILLSYNGANPDMISAQAYMKLIIIAKALNEGWTPDWSDSDEYKYVPYFIEKSGFGLAYDGYGGWFTDTFVGSRLCFKTKELAIYAATQFADIYNDFLTIK